MFKFRKKTGQAKRRAPAVRERSFEWKKVRPWLLLLPPLALGGYFLAQSDEMLPIRSIHLAGSFENLDQREVENALESYIGQGFFSLDIHQLQQSLHARPWTDSVSVRRIWPDKLHVTITEKKPVARWDSENLLSDSARVYPADTREFAKLPLVNGAGHDPERILRRFYGLQARFREVDENLVALRVDSRGAIEVELLGGLQIKVGRDDVDRKIERLIDIYRQQIQPRREQIERIDLRYSNGFAVAWKEKVLQGSDKASIWSNSNV